MIGAAHVALAGEGGAIDAGSDRALTFGGQPSVTDPARRADRQRPGRPRRAAARQRRGQPVPARDHADHDLAQRGRADGLHLGRGRLHRRGRRSRPPQTITSRIFLSEILVDAAPDARAVVTFGDSITDGAASTPDANHRWPDFLAERLDEAGAQVAVAQPGHLRRPRAARPHGRQRARPLRSRRAEPAARRHRGADDGHQRHRLAGHDPGAQGRAGALGRRHHRRLRAADRPRPRARHEHHRRDADAVRGHLPRPPAVRLLQRGEGGEAARRSTSGSAPAAPSTA